MPAWSVSSPPADAGSLIIPGGGSGFTSRSIIFADSSGGLRAASTRFQWDSTNSFLGINTTAPSGPLQVNTPDNQVVLAVHPTSTFLGVGTTAPSEKLHLFQSAPSPTFLIECGSTDLVSTPRTNLRLLNYANSTFQSDMILRNGSSGGEIIVRSTGSNVQERFSIIMGLANQLTLNIETTGTTSKIGFWTTVGSTRATGYATTGTTGRTMNSTVTPAAVYTSDVGAQLNVLQGVVKTLIQDLSANAGYGLLGSTV